MGTLGLILILLVVLVVLVIVKIYLVDRRGKVAVKEGNELEIFNDLKKEFDGYHEAGNMKKAREIFKQLKNLYKHLPNEEKMRVNMDWDFGKVKKEIINR